MLPRTPAVLAAIRWLSLVLLLAGLAISTWAAESAIDRVIKPLCPDSWWHTSAFWAHCAYPPASIAKYAAMYGLFAALGLLLIHSVAPVFRMRLGRLLLLVLALPPAYHLLLVKFSWVETAKLTVIVLLSLIYGWVCSHRAASQSLYSKARSG